MLTKNQFEEFLNAQRCLILSLALSIDNNQPELVEENINYLWESCEDLANLYGISLKTREGLIKETNDISYLEELYNA